jgi:NTP pyrophosphatase (non-canonical NTP hydrolase)
MPGPSNPVLLHNRGDNMGNFTLKEIIELLIKFRDERDWSKYHSPKNLACSISIEANELLELFQWADTCKNTERLRDEIADIAIYLLYICHDLNIDLRHIIQNKIKQNEKKYPIDRSKGNSKKYNEK